MSQIVFRSFPIGFIHHLFEPFPHANRDGFVSSFLPLVSFSTIFDNGLHFLMKGWIFCFKVLHEDPCEHEEAFFLTTHILFPFRGTAGRWCTGMRGSSGLTRRISSRSRLGAPSRSRRSLGGGRSSCCLLLSFLDFVQWCWFKWIMVGNAAPSLPWRRDRSMRDWVGHSSSRSSTGRSSLHRRRRLRGRMAAARRGAMLRTGSAVGRRWLLVSLWRLRRG